MRDRRTKVRNLCSDIVELFWKDSFGRHYWTKGVLEDVTNIGACVQTESAIPLQVDVEFRLRDTAAAARICYCTLIDGGYFVGMKFSQGQIWSGVSGPQHLLTLPAEYGETDHAFLAGEKAAETASL